MAKLKLKKMPKKPKASASISTMENYLKKIEATKKANKEIESLNKKASDLRKKISGI